MYSAKYTRCFRALMDLEGWSEVTHDPHDPGGTTRWGVSQLGYPDEDIEALTEQRAMFLYDRDYWAPLRCEGITHEATAFQLFESAVHMDAPGKPRRATRIAQGALILHGVKVTFDGLMGPETVNALNSYRYKDSLLKWMNLLQGALLLVGTTGEDDLVEHIKTRLGPLQRYARGWGRRLQL